MKGSSKKLNINIVSVFPNKFLSTKTLNSVKIRSNLTTTDNLPLIQSTPTIAKTEPNSIHINSKKNLSLFKQKRPNYLKPNKDSVKYKIQKEFNRLYGLSEDYFKAYNSLRNERNLSLSEHQSKLLSISTNLSRDNVLRLYTEFKNIKSSSEVVKPLPPVNFHQILEHSRNELKKQKSLVKKKKKPLKEELSTKTEKDPFEEEMASFKLGQSSMIKKENPALLKIFYTLPEYLVDALLKKKNK